MYSNIKRLYIQQSLKKNEELCIVGKRCHYLRNVIRVKKDDIIRIFNGKDGEWLGKLIKIEKKVIFLNIEKKIRNQEQNLDLWLFFAPIKKDRLNILIQKSTEVGVSKFIPIKTERGNIGNINIINLKQNAITASEQSERLDVPEVNEKINLDGVYDFNFDKRCLLYCDEQNLKNLNLFKTLYKIKSKFSKWSIIIGPEGGFSLEEKKAILKLKNVFPVSLGKRLLRSDTAATVALFSIQQFIED